MPEKNKTKSTKTGRSRSRSPSNARSNSTGPKKTGTKRKTVSRKAASSKRKPPGKLSSKTSRTKRIMLWLCILLLITFSVYLFFLDQKITQRFEGKIWQLPAHVYARPLELFVGKSISVEQLKFELEYLNYQQVDQLPRQIAQYRQLHSTFEIKTRKFVFWDGSNLPYTSKFLNNFLGRIVP